MKSNISTVTWIHTLDNSEYDSSRRFLGFFYIFIYMFFQL